MTCFTSSRARPSQRTPTGAMDGHRVPARSRASCTPAAAAAEQRSEGQDRFPAPTGSGRYRSTLVLAIGPFRDWLTEHMAAHELTATDVGQRIGTDEAVVRGWFGVRPRDWRQHTGQRFVVHVISETTVEAVGIALAGNPRLAMELYPHLAEAVCQHCGATASCQHLSRDLKLTDTQPLAA
jgi:hypothetical protein